jgi:hypothetical protein
MATLCVGCVHHNVLQDCFRGYHGGNALANKFQFLGACILLLMCWCLPPCALLIAPAKEAAESAKKVLAAVATGEPASKVMSSGIRLATSAECHASRVCCTLHTGVSSVPSRHA